MLTQSTDRPHRQFHAKQVPFSLWRLTDEEYEQLRSQSFPIQFNELSILWLRGDCNSSDALTLPKVLLLLEAEFGLSSRSLDTWKQTFCFPFLMVIAKPIGSFHYLFNIADYRGGLEFRLYRVVDDAKYTDRALEVFHSPLADELTETEIIYVIAYLWGYLEGRAKVLCDHTAEIEPFFRHVDSNHVIYGYWNGNFVEEVIEDPDEYQKKIELLKQQYGKPVVYETEKINDIQRKIQSITE
jgi:hypothetical protein